VAALELAAISDYDLIVLDVLMPGIGGLDVCRRLRAEGIAAPILMLTARGEPDQRVEGLDVGADDYLAKPYHFPELLARIRALLRRGRALASSVLQIEDLRIDTRTRHVHRGHRSVQLTSKEYALLEYLTRRQGDVVSRADIAEHVWDDSFDPLSNLIEVYIQRLRRKIDDDHRVKLLRTHRGAGYSLQAARDDAGAED
jgi:two-component system copper resistance phosphate regulon response regulator CusR